VHRHQDQSDQITSPTPLVRMENICVSYGNVIALDGVNFQIGKKEIVGLIGDNGAGKTTLVNTLTGYCKPYAGKIYLDGHLVSFHSPKEAQRSGIEIKYQGSPLIETMSVAHNFFLGREPYKRPVFFGRELRHPRFVDRKKMNEILRQELGRLRIRNVNYFDDYPGMLSGGQKEAITIARALYFGVRLLILDEPTTALSEEETSIVLNLVRKAKQNGLSVVFITHKADEVFQVADRFVVLRNGRNFANVEKGSIDLRQLETLDMYARLTAIKELSSSLAHQISTPLTVMKLSVEMLQDGFSVTRKKDEYRKITAMLIRKIEALQYMAKNLLDYVKPLTFRKENVHVGELIASVMEDMPMKDFNDVRPFSIRSTEISFTPPSRTLSSTPCRARRLMRPSRSVRPWTRVGSISRYKTKGKEWTKRQGRMCSTFFSQRGRPGLDSVSPSCTESSTNTKVRSTSNRLPDRGAQYVLSCEDTS